MRMSDPIVQAFIRAAYNAIGTGSLVAVTTWAVTNDPKEIIVPTAIAILGILGFRGGGEGTWDQRKKPDQNVPPAAALDNLGDH